MLDIENPYINNEIKSLIKEKYRLQRLYSKWPITCGKQVKSTVIWLIRKYAYLSKIIIVRDLTVTQAIQNDLECIK